MSILIDLQNPNNPVRMDTSGQLSGLAFQGVYLSTTSISNVSGDSQGGGYPYAYGVFTTSAPVSGAWGASGNPAVYGWMLPSFASGFYETALQYTGTTSTPPVARAADFIWPFDATQSGVVRTQFAPVPIVSGIKMLFWNSVSQLFPGSGMRCDLYFTTDGMT
jgi:hypothetical protein